MKQKSCIIYIRFKWHITESIDLIEPTPKNIVIDTEPKLGVSLVSHKKLVPTLELENLIITSKFSKN